MAIFDKNLEFGQAGEGKIAEWFINRGFSVLPIYEKIINTGKGPRLFVPEGKLIAPDMLVFRGTDALWIEAKHKMAFTLHRITNKWVTGIDLRHYVDYLMIDDNTAWPVWLLFLQEGGQAKDSPIESPKGLYGNKLSYLRQNENHRSEKWGKSGMVYWAIDKLKLLSNEVLKNNS